MRTLLFLTLTASLSLAAAQTSKSGVAVLPTPDGAYLRWYLPGDVLPAGGFTLRLSGPDGARTVTVASPQPYTPSLGLPRTDYDSLVNTYKAPARSDSERTQRAFFGLSVVARPAYARALGIMTTLRDLKPGQYTVTVTAGSPATKVGQATFTTAPLTPVPVPGLPIAKAAPAAVGLSWPVSATASSRLVVAYNVYRAAGSGPFALLKPAPFFLSSQPGGDVFRDTDLTAKTTYRYQVASVDLFGRESQRSAPVTVTTEAVTVLPAPENLEASVRERAVTLRWTPAKDSRIVQQLVVRGTDPSQPLSVLATLKPGDASYTDSTGRAGEPYVYAVVARDAGGQVGARSSLISARPVNTVPPAAPSGVKIRAAESALTLSWDANREDDVRGYQVYRSESEGPGAPALLVNTEPVTGTTFTDPLSAGLLGRYYYRVTALNTSQTESPRSGAVSSTLIDKTPAPAPALLPFSVNPQGVRLSWTQADLPDLAGFRVLRSVAGSAPVELGRLSAATRTYLDEAAQAGVTYTYSVQSVDAAGNVSAPSEPVAIRRSAVGVPDAPKRVEVSPLGTGLGNRVAWTTVSGISVVVYRLDAVGSPPLQVSGMTTGGPFIDAQGTPDSLYQLRAVDERGQVSVLTPPHPVAKP